MYTIEFQATVKNGMIEIPRKYLNKLAHRVRVILLVEENSKTTANFIDQLLAHPINISGFRPLPREEIHGRKPNNILLH